MGKILFDSKPITVAVELATLIGLNEAIVLQQVHYWKEINQNKKEWEYNFKDGHIWTYNTMDEWCKEFPFFSKSTLIRTFEKLKSKGLLVTGNYNKESFDRTLWYRVDYEKLEKLQNEKLENKLKFQEKKYENEEKNDENKEKNHEKSEEKNEKINLKMVLSRMNPHNVKMTKCIMSKWQNAKCQNDKMHNVKMTLTIPEITTKITPEITPVVVVPENCIKNYEENIRKMGPKKKSELMGYINLYGAEYVNFIIDYCVKKEAHTFDYFEKVIKSYINKRCTTIDAVKKDMKEFYDDKKHPANRSKKKQHNFENRSDIEGVYKEIEDVFQDSLSNSKSLADQIKEYGL